MDSNGHFYLRVQKHCLDVLVKGGSCVTSEWDQDNVFVSVSGSVFYVVPKTEFYLSEKLERPAFKLFPDKNKPSCSTQVKTEIVQNGIYQAKLSGASKVIRPLDFKNPGQLLEVLTNTGAKWVDSELFVLFPKNRKLASSSCPHVLVLSRFNVILGGVMPCEVPFC